MNRTGLFLPSEVDPTYYLPFDLEANNVLPPARWTDFVSMVGSFVWEVLFAVGHLLWALAVAAFCILAPLAVVVAMYLVLGGGK